MTAFWRLPMDECGALSISPDGRFAATFALSKYFEVRELKTGTVQRMQVPIVPSRSPAGATGDHRMQLGPIKNQPVCFAHEGFAVAGASNESQVHVWDAKYGNQLLSLDHGEGSNVHAVVTAYFEEDDEFLIATGTKRHGNYYVSLWLTVPRDGDTAHTFSEQIIELPVSLRLELGFTRGDWVKLLLVVLVLAPLLHMFGEARD